MKLHNFYTVKSGGKTVTAFNSLATDFWQKAAQYPHWANYLALTADDGTMVSAAAELQFVNCDILHGGALRASYSAEVICGQKRYVRASLCCADDASGEMSGADIEIDGGGESAHISAVILLEVNAGDGVCVSAGNNPLLKRLLGCGGDTEFRIGWGECDYPARPCRRSEDLIGGIQPAEFAGQSGMHIRSINPTFGCEVMLYGGDDCVLRALRPYSVSARAVSATADEHRALLLADKPVESIYNISVGGEKMLRVDSCRVISSAVAAVDGKILNLGVDGEIKSDPAGEYLLLVTTGYAEVFKVDALDLTSVLKVTKTDEQAEICRGGSLALWGPTALTIYERNQSGEYESFVTSFPTGTNRIVVREGDRYHCAYRRSTAFYRYEVTKSSSRQAEQARITTTLFFAARCGDAIAFGDKTLKVKTIDVDLSADYDCTVLSTHTQTRTLCGTGNNFLLTREGGTGYVYDFIHNRIDTVNGEMTANGNLMYDNEYAYVYDHYNGMRKLEGSYSVAGASGVCIAGSGLWVLSAGKLYAYYLSGCGLAVLLPKGSEGKQVLLGVREREYEGVGKKAKFVISG